MTNYVCSKSKCVALASQGGLCAPHAAGFDRNDAGGEMRCGDCRGLIRKDEWFQKRSDGTYHVKTCKVHPDVLKERADKAAKESRETATA